MLGALEPDVVALSEVTAKRADELGATLSSIGLLHQTSAPNGPPTDPYRVLVASRTAHELEPWAEPPPFPNRVLRVRFDGLSVVGFHAPDQPEPGRTFYKWLAEATAPMLSGDAAMLGDTNADPDDQRLPLSPYFASLVDSGWVHALRAADPDGDHQSFFVNASGYAIYHALLSPSVAPRLDRAKVLAEVAGDATAGPDLRISTGALSDHQPLLVDLSARAS